MLLANFQHGTDSHSQKYKKLDMPKTKWKNPNHLIQTIHQDLFNDTFNLIFFPYWILSCEKKFITDCFVVCLSVCLFVLKMCQTSIIIIWEKFSNKISTIKGLPFFLLLENFLYKQSVQFDSGNQKTSEFFRQWFFFYLLSSSYYHSTIILSILSSFFLFSITFLVFF